MLRLEIARLKSDGWEELGEGGTAGLAGCGEVEGSIFDSHLVAQSHGYTAVGTEMEGVRNGLCTKRHRKNEKQD